jgi:hypothetical protein
LVSVTPQDFAYNGDNPRGVILYPNQAGQIQFDMAGNADSTLNKTTPVAIGGRQPEIPPRS